MLAVMPISIEIGRLAISYGRFWVEVENLDKVYRTLIEEGFVHHASMIYGDYIKPLVDVAKLLGIKTVVV